MNPFRSLSDAGINWGAFRDHTGMHMNAHANNFVLVNEDCAIENNLTVFLAPLDFDMAYDIDNCDFGELSKLCTLNISVYLIFRCCHIYTYKYKY